MSAPGTATAGSRDCDGRRNPRRRRPAADTLAGRITAARLARSLTQAQLAAVIDVPLRTVQRWESGESEPRAGQLEALARACGVKVQRLLGG